ncbi:plasminogen activator inhibitor 2, macrophage-like [Drosophila elegans]|uniref:plasminogen activator inhibitor 2, macrophage-like n=1 Tax=Drosophila elegans TaxID=30023 RepID=UPI0007E7DE29|nr:plasminogen activator inhibitor 2, macrophage-like [Drosophila elegans]
MKYPQWLKLIVLLLFLGGGISSPSLTNQLIYKWVSGPKHIPPGVLICHPVVLTALETLSVLTDGETHKEFNGLYVRPLRNISESLRFNHTNTLLLRAGTEVLDSGIKAIENLATLHFIDFIYPRRSLYKFNEALKETHQSSYFPSILQRRYINWDTELISVGTATMTAHWIHNFEPKNSGLRVFHSQLDKHGGIRPVAIDSMSIVGNFLFSEFDGLQLLHLPLNHNITLLILLSRQVIDNKSYEIPNQYNPLELLKKGKMEFVEVQMPKIEFEYRAELVPRALNGMGIRRVHQKNADFSKLTSSKIKLSSMVHATSIRIDEFGINEEPFEIGHSAPLKSEPEKLTFIADRPFFFSILNETQLLFSGEFLGP